MGGREGGGEREREREVESYMYILNLWSGLVMLCDCVGRENVVFTYSRGGAAAEPIHSTCAAHVAACYG